jgi:hypothetical protein
MKINLAEHPKCIHIIIMLLLCTCLNVEAENLFFIAKDASDIKNWGSLKNKPAGTGEITFVNGELSLVRKQKGGDFKIIKVFSLQPSLSYSFKCRLRKKGGGKTSAKIKILFCLEGQKNWETLLFKKIGEENEWKNINMNFKIPDSPGRICFQFLPPSIPDGNMTLAAPSLTLVSFGSRGNESPKEGNKKIMTEKTDTSTASIQQITSVPDEKFFGARIQRTMTLLKTSNSKRKRTVKILFYGQSIVMGMHWRAIIAELERRYPYADIVVENRAIGGFTAPSLVRSAIHDLYSYYPDLVIFHVYTANTGHWERIIYNIRKYTTAEIMIYTHTVASAADLPSRTKSDDIDSDMIRYIAQKYNCELVEVRNEWKKHLLNNNLKEKDLMGDGIHPNVHPNDEGHALLAQMVLRHFHYNTVFPGGWFNTVKTYEAKRALEESAEDDEIILSGSSWKASGFGVVASSPKDVLKLNFTGNRVDVAMMPYKGRTGSAKILIDGKKTSAFETMYTCTRPTPAHKVIWPAVKRITLGKNPVPEKWSLVITKISDDAKDFTFELTGSVTGIDGKGSNKRRFVSNSGRIIINPKDFMIETAQTYRKIKCPSNFKISWEVKPMFVDTWKPSPNQGKAVDNTFTLFQGLENRKHTLEIIPNGDGKIPIKSIIVYTPPLK